MDTPITQAIGLGVFVMIESFVASFFPRLGLTMDEQRMSMGFRITLSIFGGLAWGLGWYYKELFFPK